MPSNAKAGIHDIRERISFLREALRSTSAESLEQSQPELREAAEWLLVLQSDLTENPPESKAERRNILVELEHLREELGSVSTLTAHGVEFCRQWGNALQSAAGYLASGEAAPLGNSTTIVLEG